MKLKRLALAIPLALGLSSGAHAALFDTFEGLSHSETESGFVSGTDLLAPYSFDFDLALDSVLTFSGESSFGSLALGLFDGSTLLRGWFLTPETGNDVTTFELTAGSYSIKSIASATSGVPLSSASGYYVFETSAVSAVPEPESYALFLAGLGMIGLVARRKLDAEH